MNGRARIRPADDFSVSLVVFGLTSSNVLFLFFVVVTWWLVVSLDSTRALRPPLTKSRTYPDPHPIISRTDHPYAHREAKLAVEGGALELDMVLNYPFLQCGAYGSVFDDIEAVRNAAPSPVLLKCILETSQLNREQIVAGCVIAAAAGVDFVKTSTGFKGSGATVEDVALMYSVVQGKGVQVKASGGVRNLRDCLEMIDAGADRIGASAGVKIMDEKTREVL